MELLTPDSEGHFDDFVERLADISHGIPSRPASLDGESSTTGSSCVLRALAIAFAFIRVDPIFAPIRTHGT